MTAATQSTGSTNAGEMDLMEKRVTGGNEEIRERASQHSAVSPPLAGCNEKLIGLLDEAERRVEHLR